MPLRDRKLWYCTIPEPYSSLLYITFAKRDSTLLRPNSTVRHLTITQPDCTSRNCTHTMHNLIAPCHYSTQLYRCAAVLMRTSHFNTMPQHHGTQLYLTIPCHYFTLLCLTLTTHNLTMLRRHFLPFFGASMFSPGVLPYDTTSKRP